MPASKIKNPVFKLLLEYGVITIAVEIIVVGIYFFKFPNHFAFGGVSGFSSVFSQLTGISASSFTNYINYGLLVIGFLFLGKSVGTRTVYATIVMSLSLSFLEAFCPMDGPLTQEPLLELIFAIICPAIGSAILFNISASSGGTDIIAMILRKYTSINIGTALLLVDVTSVIMAFYVFGPSTGLFSTLGLVGKSLGIDTIIESINRCKCFTVICDEPEPICHFIIHTLHRSATVYHAQGAFSHQPKMIILTTVKPSQAIALRNYIRRNSPTAFVQITNSSEIVGKGFLSS